MTASQHTIAGTVLTMPVRIRKATQHMAMFSVKADAAQQMIDYSGLKVTVGQISDRLAKHGAPSFTNYEQKYEAQVGNLYAALIAERAQVDPE